MYQESGLFLIFFEELVDICEFDLQEDFFWVVGFYRKVYGYLEMIF